MKPLDERLNDQLDRVAREARRNGQQAGDFTRTEPDLEPTSEISELVELARRLQGAPQLQVTPDFARQLEQRLLGRHAELRLQQGSKRHVGFALPRIRPVLGVAFGLILLFCLVSTGVLALATRASNPSNPLYMVKRWEQYIEPAFSRNPIDRADLNLQFAQDRLAALSSVADANHGADDSQALTDLDQQINVVASDINNLPAGAPRAHLTDELANLKQKSIQNLRHVLSGLAFPERVDTTNELARLGDVVPSLTGAELTLPAHPNEGATISFSGSNLQSGAQVLGDSKVLKTGGTLQNGRLVFVVEWNSNQSFHTLSLLNPDGTAAETTAIIIKDTSGGNKNGNGNKPAVTPTPHGNKPSATPTPHGNKPTVTPIPHGKKPTVTPTPHGNKPTVTPTPHGNKPTVTPTPHGNRPSTTSTPHGNKPTVTPTPHH